MPAAYRISQTCQKLSVASSNLILLSPRIDLEVEAKLQASSGACHSRDKTSNGIRFHATHIVENKSSSSAKLDGLGSGEDFDVILESLVENEEAYVNQINVIVDVRTAASAERKRDGHERE